MSPAPHAAARSLWAPQAWVDGRWREAVSLVADEAGRWAAVEAGTPPAPGAECLAGPALPGLVDAHSHTFQRAFAGWAESREGAHDDFWSWRDRMYRVALAITPSQMRAVATHLYIELLHGGYTQVCEFHYLHHAADGRRHDEPAAMSLALAEAAVHAGIGLTLLPAVYERAGFDRPALRDDQRRFAASADDALALRRAVRAAGLPLVDAGAALHSLRAVRPDSLQALAEGLDGGPLHLHVAEQTAEVDDCLAATGCRPIEWLARHAPLDARWQLVHATHATPREIEAVAGSGAGVVLCPGTEANLGDGLPDLPRWLAAGVPLSVGSDSQVTRAWPEELRWLEYGQRLLLRRRNVAAAPQDGQPATAARLFERMRAGGAAACRAGTEGLQPGARADLLVVDPADGALLGVPPERTLDALLFATPGRPFRDVMVAGRWRIRQGRHDGQQAAAAAFSEAMAALHGAAR